MNSKYHCAMPTIIRLIQALYEIDSCSCGGLGHVVIDENNVEDIHLERTIELCNEEQSKDKPERFLVICIMEYLKLLTEEQRKLLFALMEDKDGNADPDYLDEPSFDVWYEWYMSKHQNDSMHDVIAGTPVQIPESFIQGKYCGGIVKADENLQAIMAELRQFAKDNPVPDDVIRGHRMTDAEAMDAYTPFQPIIDFPTCILGSEPIDPTKMTCKMIYNRGDQNGLSETVETTNEVSEENG